MSDEVGNDARSLLLAVALTAALGVGLVVYAGFLVAQWLVETPAEPVNASLIIAFCLAWGAGIVACARGLSKRRRWARGPVITSALILFTVGWLLATGRGLEVWFGWLVVVLTVGTVVSLLRPAVAQALR